jgi:hypothetical protein
LAIGAEWNSLTVGPIGSTISARIIAQERIQTPAGTFDTFVLGYTIGSNASRIWLSHNIPLPASVQIFVILHKSLIKVELLHSN